MLPSCVRPLPPTIASTGSGSAHGADLGQVAPVALRVHAEAEDEAVGYLEPDEIGADGLRPREALLDQHRAVEARRAKLEQPLADCRHRLAAVEDVVEREHRAPLHAR